MHIISYVRDSENNPVAIFSAIPVGEEEFSIGFSKCNPKDTFNKKFGKNIAIERAKQPKTLNDIITKLGADFNELNRFIARCNRYYKNRSLANED